MQRNRSVYRAFAIIEHLAKGRSPQSVRQLARDLDMDPATAHRFLSSLHDLGYVRQTPDDSRYHLTLKFAWLASRVTEQSDLARLAHPVIVELAQTTGETVHLAVLDGNSALYVDKVDSDQAVQMRSRIGARADLHSTALGKAILAFVPGKERERILASLSLVKLTDSTTDELRRLREELQKVSENGYATDNEENEVGIRCVGAPIFDHAGELVAALSVSGWTVSMRLERFPQLSGQVVAACAEISRTLGYDRDFVSQIAAPREEPA